MEPGFSDLRRSARNKHYDRTFDHPKAQKARAKNVRTAVARNRREQRAYKLSPLVPWSKAIKKAEAAYAAFDYVRAAWYVNNEWVGQDLRGSADHRRTSLWSRISRIVCAFKAVGGKPAITVRRRSGLTVHQTVVKDLLGGKDSSKAFDVFFAWRCGCANNHEVVYKTLEDLPAVEGYHDACPHCGQAPLEVLASPKDPKQLSLLKYTEETDAE